MFDIVKMFFFYFNVILFLLVIELKAPTLNPQTEANNSFKYIERFRSITLVGSKNVRSDATNAVKLTTRASSRLRNKNHHPMKIFPHRPVLQKFKLCRNSSFADLFLFWPMCNNSRCLQLDLATRTLGERYIYRERARQREKDKESESKYRESERECLCECQRVRKSESERGSEIVRETHCLKAI